MNLEQVLSAVRHSGPRPLWIRYLLLFGVFTLLTRVILDSRFSQSAVLYILVPYLVAVAVYIFVPRPKGHGRWKRFLGHMRAALIVMLGTSAFLFEGIICVLMFLPIYLIVCGIVFAMQPAEDTDPSNVFRASFVPLLIFALSLEGTSKMLSFEREETVTRSLVIDASIETLHGNMAAPIAFTGERSTFLSLFPLPYEVTAGTLGQGDVHKTKFAYKRWLVTNVHFGETWLELTEVSKRRIRTTIVKDTSYFSKYLTIHGTEVTFTPLASGHTKVDLAISYRRDLDPVWYFGPLQRAAMGQSADYLLSEVIARDQKVGG